MTDHIQPVVYCHPTDLNWVHQISKYFCYTYQAGDSLFIFKLVTKRLRCHFMIKSFSSLEIRIATQKHYQTINGHQAIHNTLIKFHTFYFSFFLFFFLKLFHYQISCLTALHTSFNLKSPTKVFWWNVKDSSVKWIRPTNDNKINGPTSFFHTISL